jgi:hypothetical protein
MIKAVLDWFVDVYMVDDADKTREETEARKRLKEAEDAVSVLRPYLELVMNRQTVFNAHFLNGFLSDAGYIRRASEMYGKLGRRRDSMSRTVAKYDGKQFRKVRLQGIAEEQLTRGEEQYAGVDPNNMDKTQLEYVLKYSITAVLCEQGRISSSWTNEERQRHFTRLDSAITLAQDGKRRLSAKAKVESNQMFSVELLDLAKEAKTAIGTRLRVDAQKPTIATGKHDADYLSRNFPKTDPFPTYIDPDTGETRDCDLSFCSPGVVENVALWYIHYADSEVPRIFEKEKKEARREELEAKIGRLDALRSYVKRAITEKPEDDLGCNWKELRIQLTDARRKLQQRKTSSEDNSKRVRAGVGTAFERHESRPGSSVTGSRPDDLTPP